MLVIATVIPYGTQNMMAKNTPCNAVAGEAAILVAPTPMEACKTTGYLGPLRNLCVRSHHADGEVPGVGES